MQHATLSLILPLAALLSPALTSQPAVDPRKDTRDRIELIRGRTIECRVLDAHDPSRVLYLGSSSSVKAVDRKQVRSVTLLRHNLAKWIESQTKAARTDVAAQWQLVAEAQKLELLHLGRVQAMLVQALADGKHQEAHALLGNRLTQGQWKWRERFKPTGDWVPTAKAFDPDRAYEIRSEHWILDTDTSLREGVTLLLDLERLYVAFMAELGPQLGAREVVYPMRVKVRRNADDIEKLNSRSPMPYAVPGPQLDEVDRIHTFCRAENKRPVLVFDLAVEQILNKTLMNERASAPRWRLPDPDRFAPWLEIGLGRWFGSRVQGDPGYLELGKPAIDAADGIAVLTLNLYGLENLIGLRMMHFHEPNADRPLHWANAATFVAFLMHEDSKFLDGKSTRTALVSYLRAVFVKGNSSSLLDAHFGTKVEKLEKAWIAFVEHAMGRSATRAAKPLRGGAVTFQQVLRGF